MWRPLSRTEKILESINGITLSRQDIAKFGDVVHDYSPAHRNVEEAKKFGFLDTPVIGVHLASIGSRLSRDLMSVLQTPDRDFVCTNQQVTFRDPVYPNEAINWDPPELEVEGEVIRYRLIVPNTNREQKPRVEMISEFSTLRPQYSEMNSEKLVFSEDIEFTPKETRTFYECLREEPSKTMVFSQGISRVPSVLLSFAGNLSDKFKTEIGGKNIGMQSTSYRELKTGGARIDIYEFEKKGRGNRVFYTFDGVLLQDNLPVISSRVKTLTNGEFRDIYALAEQFQPAERTGN